MVMDADIIFLVQVRLQLLLGIKAYLEQNDVSGTVILYGCPGEEGGAAKAFMARDGSLEKTGCSTYLASGRCK